MDSFNKRKDRFNLSRDGLIFNESIYQSDQLIVESIVQFRHNRLCNI